MQSVRILFARARMLFARARAALAGRDELFYIGGPDTLPAPIDKRQEEEVFRALEQGSAEARDTLITHNLRLVVYIAKKFENTGVGVEDLVSIGTIGLIKAVNTFSPSKNIKLATYASRCIENEILMFLRKNANKKQEQSIDEPLNIDWDGNELLLSDILGSDSDCISRGVETEAEHRAINEMVGSLSRRDREIIMLRFGLCGAGEHTQKEVAERIGISQSYISRLEKRIIVRLRRELEREL